MSSSPRVHSWSVILIGLFVAVSAVSACKSRSTREGPDGADVEDEHAVADAPGFERIEAGAFTLAIPEGFEPADAPDRAMSMNWLVHRRKPDAPGAPRILFARHSKPADFPSHVFGLTALEGLNRAPDKEVEASRQHRVRGLEATDIEVVAGPEGASRTQWRRLFVHDHVAYTLTYSVATADAERHREQAGTVLDSLVPQ
jgi:hypothetical protein